MYEEAMAHRGGGWFRAKNKQNIPMYLPFYNQLVFIYFGVNLMELPLTTL